MIKHLTFDDFLQAFKDYGREDQFTYEAKLALWDWIHDYEESTGEQTELDIIALCVEWSEYDSLEEIRTMFDDGGETLDSIEDLQQQTDAELLANDHVLMREF